MELQFLALRDEHLPAAAAIYNYYIENSTATFHTELLSPSGLREIIYHESPRYLALAILADGQCCGYAYIGPYRERQAYQNTAEISIYLHADFTGQGIGTAALRLLEEHAKAQGIWALLAGICSENQESYALFNKSGYEKCAHLRQVGVKFGRLLDVIYLEKIIGCPAVVSANGNEEEANDYGLSDPARGSQLRES
jgi:L-amino acid N-acyltransferase YncA